MGMNYLWDTNTAIYYLQQQFSVKAEKYIDGLLMTNKVSFSSISEIELLCWKNSTPKDLEVLNDFIKDAHVFELEKSVRLKTVEIRKLYKIKLPDAIIAATAMTNNLTLLSRNVSDFKQIDGLNLINPWEQ